jgi:hypothetical protein
MPERSPRPGFLCGGGLGTALSLALLCVFCPTSARAATAYDGFDYPVGTPNTAWNGGSGFGGRWIPEVQGQIAAGSLSDPTNTLATSGNHADGRYMNRQVARGTTGADFWVGYLMRRTADTTGSPDWSGLLMTGGTGTYFVGEPGGGAGDNTLIIGSGDDSTYVSSGVPFEPGRDYFIVSHIETGAGNDRATLYVNPTPGTEAPTGGVTFSGSNFIPGVPMFAFDANVSGTVTASFDELRIGDTYAEVAPAVPEPGAIGAGAVTLLALALQRRRVMPRRSGR